MTDTTEQDARTPAEIIAEAFGLQWPFDWPAEQLIEALESAGHIIVPKEPTEAQVSAGARAFDEIDGDEGWLVEFTAVYRAMTSAHKDAA